MEIKLTSENFEQEVLNSDVPVLVDFWAEWCNPCRMLAPAVEELATEAEGKYKVGKVDIDQYQDLAQQFRVMSIPTVLIFKDGKVAETSVGTVPKSKLQGLVEKHV